MQGPGLHFLSQAHPGRLQKEDAPPHFASSISTWILPFSLFPSPAVFGLVHLQRCCLLCTTFLPREAYGKVSQFRRTALAQERLPEPCLSSFRFWTVRGIKTQALQFHPSWIGPLALNGSATVELHFPTANTAADPGHKLWIIIHLV